jgi:uncharacterized protein YihD (DUF1040 family)
MTKTTFCEEDKTKTIEFLNSVAKHARFEMNTEELIAYFKLLSYMQKVILSKIDANILEIKKVHENTNVDAGA